MADDLVRARLDQKSRAALRFLKNCGMTESEAVRTALLEAAEARSTDDALRAECERLMQDAAGVERERVERQWWDELTAPWPD